METVLEIIESDRHTKNAVMYITTAVCKFGKVNDIISFSGKNVYIRTSDDDSTLSYMHELKGFFEFNFGDVVINEKEHGVHLIYTWYNQVVFPTMITRVRELSEGVKFKNVVFDVSAIGSDLNFVRSDFRVSIAKEVL